MTRFKLKAVFILVLPVLLCSCPKENADKWTAGGKQPVKPAEEGPAFKKVEVTGQGFLVSVPEDWKVQKREVNPVVFASAPGAGRNGPSVNVVVEDLSQRMAPYDYLEANLVTMQTSLPKLEILQRGTGLHSGIQMAWILYGYVLHDKKVQAITYCQTKDYTAYVVTSMCPAERFDEYKGIFVKIGQSLRVK